MILDYNQLEVVYNAGSVPPAYSYWFVTKFAGVICTVGGQTGGGSTYFFMGTALRAVWGYAFANGHRAPNQLCGYIICGPWLKV